MGANKEVCCAGSTSAKESFRKIMSIDTKVAIIGGGIAGLALALNLKRRNIDCRVYETAPELKELGVGITFLQHATRELDALGLLDEIKSLAIENVESCF